ncbi:hypothetical protein, partial [Staphylococcus aureus]|uniref:hypothetical protein n=1 Tax=Staphylococcus aureus TaxID=1280 RepID=UPI00193C16A1
MRGHTNNCLLYTFPSPRDHKPSRMPSTASEKKKHNRRTKEQLQTTNEIMNTNTTYTDRQTIHKTK